MKLLRELLESTERKYKVHDLSSMSHRDAYYETQTNDDIKDGDVLKIKDGLAIMIDAWPVIVKGKSNVFHEFNFDIHDEKAVSEYNNGKYKQAIHDIFHNTLTESVSKEIAAKVYRRDYLKTRNKKYRKYNPQKHTSKKQD